MRRQGAEKASFDTIVASGWRGALPHGKASDKIVAAGEFVTLDFGALYQGYCSDMTRTLLVNGEGVSAESHPLFNVYQIVLQAQLAAISVIRPGVRCQQVDDAARRVITEAGYGKFFGHNTGHAIGIEVHEEPRFSPRDTKMCIRDRLKRLQADIIKIDGVFVKDIVTNTLDAMIVRSITDLAKAKSLSVVAEFVETPQQQALLHKLGVQYLQGYLIGRPQPLAD